MQSANIVIIGKGKVGQSLAQLFQLKGFEVTLVGRSFIEQQQACQNADITLITVNDGNIQRVCETHLNAFKPGSIVAHCSGALSSGILHKAKNNDCQIASVHPLNTFPTIDTSLKTFNNDKHGSYLYAEGDQTALNKLLPMFTTCGFNTHTIRSNSKALYHAACVFACNYLNPLMEMSLSTAEAAGLDRSEFMQSLQPLIHKTLSNINENGTANALSGPIARGDASTINVHLQELEGVSSSLKQSYTDLALKALDLAIQNNELPKVKTDQLLALLKND